MDPIQTFSSAIGRAKIVELAKDAKKPLPTTFRAPYSVSMSVELVELLRAIHNEHGVNVSRELEPIIKRWALKRARQINATLQTKK